MSWDRYESGRYELSLLWIVCYELSAMNCPAMNGRVTLMDRDPVHLQIPSSNQLLLLVLKACTENFKSLGAELLELSCTRKDLRGRDTIPNIREVRLQVYSE